MSRLFPTLVGTAVCTMFALAVSGTVYLTADRNPELKRVEERWLLAPGRELAHRWSESRLRRETAKEMESMPGAKLGAQVEAVVQRRVERLSHTYNVGAWTLVGFGLCLLMTTVLGVSSFLDALTLGFKVVCTLACAQAALVIYLIARHNS